VTCSSNTDTSLAKKKGTATFTKRPRISKNTQINCHDFELRLIAHLRGQDIPQQAGEGGSSSARDKA
jgi:hypothetical protein